MRTRLLAATALLSMIALACVPPNPAEPGHREADPAPPAARAGSWQLQGEPGTIHGCPSFDRASVFNSRVVGLPVHPRSDEWLGHLDEDQTIRVPIRSAVFDGTRPGWPVNVVDSRTTPPVNVVYKAGEWPDRQVNPIPMPSRPRISGDPGHAWDYKVFVLDTHTCQLYESIEYDLRYRDLLGRHRVRSTALWELREGSGLERQHATTVSGLPTMGTIVRLQEVLDGEVRHMILACSNRTGTESIWPARLSDGTDTSPSAPPIGSRLRLKEGLAEQYSGQARVIAEALRVHGLLIADTCPAHRLAIGGENVAEGWDDENLRTLEELRVGDFEVVDQTPMIISEDSLRVR